MMSSKNNGFTASDIERYHSGKMLPEERHALEKAALDDPFLADALEGYAFTSTPAEDLAKIQSRLNEKKDRKKVISFLEKNKWLSVAAIILIIAGAGWFTYRISSKENTPSLAQKKEMPAEKKISAPIDNSPDSFSNGLVKNPQPIPLEKKETQRKQKKPAETIQKSTEQVTIIPPPKDKEPGEKNNEEFFSKAKTIPSTQNDVASINSRFAGVQPVDLNNPRSLKPLANNLPGRLAGINVLKDSNTSYPIQIRGNATTDTIKDLNVVLHAIPMDSMKVVVVGYGSQKKSSNKHPRIIVDTLEPAEGLVNFDDYVANNIKMPEDFEENPISGEIQLSFEVDKNGQPINITVVKSLCEKCDEETIRLLKEGPKWKKEKNKKGKITIRF